MKVKEMLTTDEGVFEFVKQHLITQGQKAEVYGIGCLYKQSPSGLSCAVGCLIEDQFYSKDLEFTNLYTHPVKEAIQKSLPNWIVNIDMLIDLQEIHDNCEVEEWEWKLNQLEKQWFDLKNWLKEDDEKLKELYSKENK